MRIVDGVLGRSFGYHEHAQAPITELLGPGQQLAPASCVQRAFLSGPAHTGAPGGERFCRTLHAETPPGDGGMKRPCSAERKGCPALHPQLGAEANLLGSPSDDHIRRIRHGVRGVGVRTGEGGGEQHVTQVRREFGRQAGFLVYIRHDTQGEPALRQRPRLVRTDHIHLPESLNSRRSVHKRIAAGQATGNRRLP